MPPDGSNYQKINSQRAEESFGYSIQNIPNDFLRNSHYHSLREAVIKPRQLPSKYERSTILSYHEHQLLFYFWIDQHIQSGETSLHSRKTQQYLQNNFILCGKIARLSAPLTILADSIDRYLLFRSAFG